MNIEANVIRALLAWYRENRRDLPFRKNRDPYRIWISEIMAQQTRIEAMLGHYARFMEAYPSIEALAQADDDELLKIWQGLGYYSRARNLKKAAVVCMKEYNGRLPSTKVQLKKLPGIGDYTAGAIASIAFGERVSAIDGNVIRVASRFFWLPQDFSQPKEKRKLEEKLEALLPASEEMPEYTQALMELGASLCLPKSVSCKLCPLEPWCKGARQPDPLLLPYRKPKAARKVEKRLVVIRAARHEGKWFFSMHKRPEKGLLAGLYEFDWQMPEGDAGREKGDPVPLEPYRHIFSHIEWDMQGMLVLSPWQEDFLSVDEIEKRAAVPSALMPFYQQAKGILSTLASGVLPDAPEKITQLKLFDTEETGLKDRKGEPA